MVIWKGVFDLPVSTAKKDHPGVLEVAVGASKDVWYPRNWYNLKLHVLRMWHTNWFLKYSTLGRERFLRHVLAFAIILISVCDTLHIPTRASKSANMTFSLVGTCLALRHGYDRGLLIMIDFCIGKLFAWFFFFIPNHSYYERADFRARLSKTTNRISHPIFRPYANYLFSAGCAFLPLSCKSVNLSAAIFPRPCLLI